MKKINEYLENGKHREELLPLTIISGLLVLVILGCMLSFSFDFKKASRLHYEEKSNLDYRVYLKENQFYETPFLSKDKKYISALIKYIDSDFSYSFDSEENLDIKYTYYIDADLKIDDPSGENIYEKTYNILERKQASSTTDKFNIRENVKIDYDKYNNFAKQFVKQYGINAKANLEVSLFVDVVGTHESFTKNITDRGVVKLNIPLLEDLNNIEMDYDLVNNNDAVLEYSSTKINNIVLFIITIALMLADIIMTIIVVIKILNGRDATTLYELKLNKIKKEYDKYLSETVLTQRIEDLYKTKSLRIILIKTFEDLLDIRDNLKKPILFNEEIPGKETIFYIISDNIVYLYVMHINSFKKKKGGKLLTGITKKLGHNTKEEEEEIEILLS